MLSEARSVGTGGLRGSSGERLIDVKLGNFRGVRLPRGVNVGRIICLCSAGSSADVGRAIIGVNDDDGDRYEYEIG